MPSSPLSLRQTRVGGPNSSSNVNVNPTRPPHEPVHALVASRTTQTIKTIAQSSLLATDLGSMVVLQLISVRSGQPRRWQLLLWLRSCIAATRVRWRRLYLRARAETMSRLRVASTTSGKFASNMRDRKPSEIGELSSDEGGGRG